MQGAHRRIVAVIVGLAAVLAVVALSRTAALGPDGPSSQPVAATTTTTRPAADPAARAAAIALKRARADLKKALAERAAAKTTPTRRTVRVYASAPASAVSTARSGGDDDHGYEGEHEEDD